MTHFLCLPLLYSSASPSGSVCWVNLNACVRGQVLLYVMEFIVRAVLTPEVQKVTRMDVKGVGMVFAGCVMVSPSTDIATMMYHGPLSRVPLSS